jgi:epidermal growth factor receptor substrate 15
LTPPQENTYGESEDVDAVKQLISMGFSRNEAVTALERTSYDFQSALSSLVGST